MNLRERPYLDVEVVEVKVKKKKEIPEHCVLCEIKEGCGIYQTKYKKLEKEGTWVNGENLDKMEFPCVVSFNNGFCGRCYGMINKDFKDDLCTISYNLVEIGEQNYFVNAIWDYDSLEDLFGDKCKDVHIEKAKIVICKEVKE